MSQRRIRSEKVIKIHDSNCQRCTLKHAIYVSVIKSRFQGGKTTCNINGFVAVVSSDEK